jgi:hypothetical protein
VWEGQRLRPIQRSLFLFGLLRLVLRTQSRSGVCDKLCPSRHTFLFRWRRSAERRYGDGCDIVLFAIGGVFLNLRTHVLKCS